MKVFVTGASGFLGSAVIRYLVAYGHKVKALIHSQKSNLALESLDIEKVIGDILDFEFLKEAISGCQAVIHTASLYKFYSWWRVKVPEIYKVNLEGTKSILAAAQHNKVERFIYTSSIAAIGKSQDGKPSNEDTEFNLWQQSSHYARSKVLAEKEVLKLSKQGFPALVLNPAALIGAGDSKPTPTGEIIVNFLNRKYPFYFDGAISLADVDDVAQAHLAALLKGEIGQRYILCNSQTYSIAELFELLEEISGSASPLKKIPYPVLISLLYLDELFLVRKKPFFPVDIAKFCRREIKFDNSKAKKELDYQETSLKDTLAKAINWYKMKGYLKAKQE